uniref:Uncharacterized protein n=1 Tax=Cacopsylla melanoneura TaxID=428564 RepID=A0A8D8VTU1_9HEMI
MENRVQELRVSCLFPFQEHMAVLQNRTKGAYLPSVLGFAIFTMFLYKSSFFPLSIFFTDQSSIAVCTIKWVKWDKQIIVCVLYRNIVKISKPRSERKSRYAPLVLERQNTV